MASTTVTVAWNDGSAQQVQFVPFASDTIRSFLDLIPSGNVQDNKRFSIPGVDGNFLMRGGFRGHSLDLRVRYKGALSACASAWQSDRQAFAKYSCTVDDGSSTFTRCTLRSDSGQRTTPERASGASGDAFFDVRYVFDVEEQ